MLDDLLKSLTSDELKFIAERDYGIDADTHLRELTALIASPDGLPTRQQYWHPYEVIELCAHTLTPGHEREFTACTLLVLRAMAAGVDTSTLADQMLSDRAQDYDTLPAEFRDAILEAYQRIER